MKKLSGKMMNFDGIPIMVPNDIEDGEGFYVSYNSHSRDYGCNTTALVKGQGENFLILNGDHREAYNELIPKVYGACVGYFEKNIDQKNFRSDNPGQKMFWENEKMSIVT